VSENSTPKGRGGGIGKGDREIEREREREIEASCRGIQNSEFLCAGLSKIKDLEMRKARKKTLSSTW
jgi:hypothetical protein